jgi:hypothetical protein
MALIRRRENRDSGMTHPAWNQLDVRDDALGPTPELGRSRFGQLGELYVELPSERVERASAQEAGGASPTRSAVRVQVREEVGLSLSRRFASSAHAKV